MPGVHATLPATEMMQLSRLSPDIPRIDILEHEPESQMGNNLFDMFASVHFSGSGNNSSTTNNNNNNSNSSNINSFNNSSNNCTNPGNNETSLALQDKQMFPEISVFPEHTAAIQDAAGQAGIRQSGLDHGFDSFQFLRNSMFADREKELNEDSRAMQASPSSAEVEAPITKLWTDCDEPHCSDGAVSCEQLEQQRQQHQYDSYESLGKNNNNNSSLGGASFKTSSSWGVSRSSTVVEPSTGKPKRKRSRPCKSTEEVESQRMTHIAVERNRRRQMNEHLRVLRSLMPGSYVQRGDQASIIGGAIEFVKELQQLLQCLEEQKKRKMSFVESPARLLGSPGIIQAMPGGLGPYPPPACLRAPPPPDVKYFDAGGMYEPVREVYGEAKSVLADVEVKIVGTMAHIKILSQKKPGQLLKTMTALENKLLLTIIHTNVTTIEQTVLYSFDVKVGQNCGLAEEIASYIHNTLAASSSSNTEELSLQH